MDQDTSSVTPQLTVAALALFFGCLVFATIALTIHQFWKPSNATTSSTTTTSSSSNSSPSLAIWRGLGKEDSNAPLNVALVSSWYSCLVMSSLVGLVLALVFLCEERRFPFPHSVRKPDWDPDQLAAWIMIISIFSVLVGDFREKPQPHRNLDPSSLQILMQQEERLLYEAKGWTFLLFVFYQHFNHEKRKEEEDVASVPIHLFLSLYTWCAGFHHALHFSQAGGTSLTRVVQSTWKPLFLIVCFGMMLPPGVGWVLYYLCYLELLALGVTFFIFGVGTNDESTCGRLRLKVTLVAIAFYLIWDIPNPRLFLWIFGFLIPSEAWLPTLGSLSGSDSDQGALWVWYVLTTQYHWCILFGITMALNLPIALLWREQLYQPDYGASSRGSRPGRTLAGRSSKVVKVAVGVALVSATSLSWWQLSNATRNTFRSSTIFDPPMAFLFPLLLTTFLYLRTCTHWLRQRCLNLLAVVGHFALEAFVLHYHLFLNSNGSALLTVLPQGWPKLNFWIVLGVFLGLSQLLFLASMSLQVSLFSDSRTCMRNLFTVAACAMVSFLFCFLLQSLGLLINWMIAIFVVLGGSVVSSFVLWATKQQVKKEINLRGTKFWVSVIVGTLFICLLGFMGGQVATRAEERASCKQAIQDGRWFPINVCNEATQSYASREHGISSIASCSASQDVLAWGWQASEAVEPCGISVLSTSVLLSSVLKNKNLTFVGDSMIRHLYHATCRQVGDIEAGAYNTSAGKWANYSRHYDPNTALDFRWAPFTDQIIPILQELESVASQHRPDILVVGGGAWDLLHRTRTEGNRTALDANIRFLSKSLAKLKNTGQKIIWIEPTMLNTWALMTEDKRVYMREDQMVQLRNQYLKNGVPGAANFVLDGLSFSRGRVNECYDGVHYPFSVYDGGSQILLNAVNWLIPISQKGNSPEYGSLAYPEFGLLSLVLLLVCLASMDSLFGLSYLAALMVQSSPASIYNQGMELAARTRMEEPNSPMTKSKDSDQAGAEDHDLNELDAFLGKSESNEDRDTMEVIS